MRTKNPFMSRRRQLGYTLIEVLMSVGLGSLILASGTKFLMDRVDDVKDQSTAQYQSMFAEASERYVRNNFPAIVSGLTQNGPPMAISLATIRTAGYAHTGLTDMNPYRQTPCLVVRRLTDTATGGARLEALVTTEGGNSIPERRVPFVAAQSGAVGGFVPSTAPTTAQGAYGVWQTSITPYTSTSCSGTPVAANRLASGLFFDVSAAGGVNPDDVLHRVVVAGRPDLNTMNTNLNMGGFSIANANNITATGTVIGGIVQATSEAGTYAQTTLRTWGLHSTGDMFIEPGAGSALNLVDSSGGTNFTLNNSASSTLNLRGRSQFSRDNVATAGNTTIGVAEATSTTGREASVFLQNAGNTSGTFALANTASRGGQQRLIAFSAGGTMGMEVSGDFITPGGVYADVFRDYYNNGFYVQPRAVSRMQQINMPNGGNIVGEGTLYVGTAAGGVLHLQPNAAAGMGQQVHIGTGTAGTLHMADAIVRNKSSTRWLSDMMPNWVHKGTFVVSHGNTLNKPVCNSGGLPRIVLIGQMIDMPMEAYFGAGNHQAIKYSTRAFDYGSYWSVEIGAHYYWGAGGWGFWGGSGLAMIACWYS